jgi:hypothetical protein
MKIATSGLISALRSLLAGFALGTLVANANAGPVLSPNGQQSIYLSTTNLNLDTGAFNDTYTFTLATNTSVSYTTHRYTFFSGDFTDFHAFLYRGPSQLIAAGTDMLLGDMGYSNNFYISDLAAGDYRLEIGGTDLIGLGYNGDLSVFGVGGNLRAGLSPQSVPEPGAASLMLLAILGLTHIRRRTRSLRLADEWRTLSTR